MFTGLEFSFIIGNSQDLGGAALIHVDGGSLLLPGRERGKEREARREAWAEQSSLLNGLLKLCLRI